MMPFILMWLKIKTNLINLVWNEIGKSASCELPVCELRVQRLQVASSFPVCELRVNINSNDNNTHIPHFHSQGT